MAASRTAAAPTTTTRVRQLVGPLTTVYRPSLQCSDCTFSGTGSFPPNDGPNTAYTEDCYMFHAESACPSQEPPKCFPHVSEYSDIANPGWFYSPGLHCPEGWRTAATFTSGQGGGSMLFSGVMMDSLLPEETVAICCPSGHTYHPADQTFLDGGCTAEWTTKGAIYQSCFNKTKLVSVTKTDLGELINYTYEQHGPQTIALLYESIVAWAPTVQLNYRPQDINPSPASSTSPSSAITDPTSGVRQTSAATEASNSGNGSPNSLSRGAIAGIVVGAVGVLIGMGIILALWRWRRKRSNKNAGGEKQRPLPDGDGGGYTKPELAATSFNPNRGGHHNPEPEAPARFELDGANDGRVHELYGNETCLPHELPAPSGHVAPTTRDSRQGKPTIARPAVGRTATPKGNASREAATGDA
ncbi:hypothetical protein TOPH_09001 [Tolypocladium ophioglossoides CBS 100239]|uniref:Uncharacterized protein n=1 Tax=Tolypocladium ophioglossoides (strain CBS 100239) TaxID=1163406 RepID=A0A0L0MX38_TOLOC|nr:hypothetical protein TOPH_09001 [Tolypocladium ophioglossoides CBS 100239]